MMISPETYETMFLEGKTAEQIVKEIKKIRKEIRELKKELENPAHKLEAEVRPSPRTRLKCNREYLQCAIRALEKAGGTYVPTETEKRAQKFDSRTEFITKIEFSVGPFAREQTSRDCILSGDCFRIHGDEDIWAEIEGRVPDPDPEVPKENFLKSLRELHLGEWQKTYTTERFGYSVMDGIQWYMEIRFSDGGPKVKYSGSNAYPYNFKELLELLRIEQTDWK